MMKLAVLDMVLDLFSYGDGMRGVSLALAALLVGCGGHALYPVKILVDGVAVEDTQLAVASLVQRRAMRDLGCPSIAVEEASTGTIYRASGCEKVALYVSIANFGDRELFAEMRGEPGPDLAYDVLPLSEAPTPTAVRHEAVWAWRAFGWGMPAAIALALNVEGAEALGCPRAEVVPYKVVSIRARKRWRATGCGKVAEFDLGGEWLAGPAEVLPVCAGAECSEMGAPHGVSWRPVTGGGASTASAASSTAAGSAARRAAESEGQLTQLSISMDVTAPLASKETTNSSPFRGVPFRSRYPRPAIPNLWS